MINLLIKTGYPFVAFRYPHENEFINIVQNDKEVRSFHPEEMHDLSGFLLAPFDSRSSAAPLYIRHDLSYTWGPLSEGSGPVLLREPAAGEERLSVPGEEEYTGMIREVLRLIRSGRAEKVVLTRPEVVRLPEAFDYTAFFTTLHHHYPAAFIFLVFLPDQGIWAGATPEVLLDATGHYFETTALAGTLPLTREESVPDWSEKERHEQQIVTDYILEELQQAGFQPAAVSGPHTVIAGEMAHLETTIRIAVPRHREEIPRLIHALHPTPAICGYPQEAALAILRKTEGYDRQYYTGYLGPWNTRYPSRLYINLRSMHFLPGLRRAVLFAGGGITAASRPGKEWEETRLKMRTLLSVLEKMPNFTG